MRLLCTLCRVPVGGCSIHVKHYLICSVVFGISVVVVLIQNIWTCERGHDGMSEDFRGWLSLSNINTFTKIVGMGWV